jgi:site-specific recombinase
MNGWEVALGVLNVFQTLALAYMADRSRQRRGGDRRTRG